MGNAEIIQFELKENEYNVILHALNAKRLDPNNSVVAKKAYEDMYIKMFEQVHGEGTCKFPI